MSDDTTSGIDKLNKALDTTDTRLAKIVGNLDKMLGKLGGASGPLSNIVGGGTYGYGKGSTDMMQGSLGSFSTDVLKTMTSANRWAGAATIARGVFQVGAAALSGLPDTGATIARASGYYQAGLVNNGSRNRIELGTFSTLAGGISRPGEDAAVAAMMARGGVSFSMGRNSTYQQDLRTIRSMTSYLNIDTAAAAQSVLGMQSGPTSANILRNFGVFGGNPFTGKKNTTTQTFAQIRARIPNIGNQTRAQLMYSMQSGGLSTWMSSLRQSGWDEAAIMSFQQYLLNNSKDGAGATDYTNVKQIGKLSGASNNANPMKSAYDIASYQTKTMMAAEKPYIEGMKVAATHIKVLEENAALAAKSIGGFKAYLDTMAGDPAARALPATFKAVTDAVLAFIGVLAAGKTTKIVRNALGKGGVTTGGSTSSDTNTKSPSTHEDYRARAAQERITRTGGGGAGEGWKLPKIGDFKFPKIGGFLGSLGEMAFLAPYADAAGRAAAYSPQAWKKEYTHAKSGATLTDPLTGSQFIKGGASDPTITTNEFGSLFSNSLTTNGAKNTVGTGSSTPKDGTRFIHPVKGPITTTFYQTTDKSGKKLWGGSAHRAIDYGVGKGTQVKAAASGKVSESSMGSGQRSYGNYIIIDHGDGLQTVYAHLSRRDVKRGTSVSQGDLIGLSGDTGYVTGPHLHFEARKNGNRVDPAPYLGGGVTSSGSYRVPNSAPSYSASNMGMGSSAIPGGYSAILGNNMSSVGGGVSVSSYTGAASAVSDIGFGANGNVKTSGQGGMAPASSPTKNNVNITVNIKQATADEARKFASLVKDILEKDQMVASMGRF
jgi:murein DD-endopeptidase MepM/ murein hydrolase activator NlpD